MAVLFGSMSDPERESVHKRTGIKPLGRWQGRTISLDTEGERSSDLGSNILATFEWGDKEIVIRCGNAVVISSEMTVRKPPHNERDVDFLAGVRRAEFYDIVTEFQKDKSARWFFLGKAGDDFVVRRVAWHDASPGDFSLEQRQ